MNNINIQNRMQPGHNKRLLEFREKLSKLHSPPKKQHQHSLIKQLHKRNKLIEKDIESILDGISEHYFESQEIIVACTQQAIAYIRQKQSELLETLDAFKEKQLDCIKDDIQLFLKSAKKVKKIVANGSYEKLYNPDKYQSIYGQEQPVKIILKKLNKLKPESENINKIISEYALALKSVSLEFKHETSFQSSLTSQQWDRKPTNQQKMNFLKQKTHARVNTKPKNEKKFKNMNRKEQDVLKKEKKYVELSPEEEFPLQYNTFRKQKQYQSETQQPSEILLPSPKKSPKKGNNQYLLSSKSQQFIRLVHKDTERELPEQFAPNHQVKQFEETTPDPEEQALYQGQKIFEKFSNNCSIENRLHSYEEMLCQTQHESQNHIIQLSKRAKFGGVQQSGEKDTELMIEQHIDQQILKSKKNQNKNRSLNQRRNIAAKTSLIAYSNNPDYLKSTEQHKIKPIIPSNMPKTHKNLYQVQNINQSQSYSDLQIPLPNKKHKLQELRGKFESENALSRDKSQSTQKNLLEKLKKGIKMDRRGDDEYEEANKDIFHENNNQSRMLLKVKSQEYLQNRPLNQFPQNQANISKKKYETNRISEVLEKDQEGLTSVKSLDRLDKLKNTVSAGNTSRTAKKNNWMKILKDQQIRYNQMKEKIKY